jgi:hypothetical protein
MALHLSLNRKSKLSADFHASNPKVVDDGESNEISKDEIVAVRAALAAGLTEFSVPTDSDDWQREAYVVTNMVTVDPKGNPHCYLVAQRKNNMRCEILGPEVPLTPSNVKNAVKELQTRA